jgi:group I intron endonuclease
VISGIYRIVQRSTGLFYLGSSVDISRRWRQHVRDLNAGVHHSLRLQRAWSKYGAADFEFLIEQEASAETLRALEESLLNELRPAFNAWLSASGMPLGGKHSEATKAKVRGPGNPFFGRKHTPETRARMAAASTGRQLSPETRAKIAASKLGKKRPDVTERIRQQGCVSRGHKMSPKARARISAANKGRERPDVAERNRHAKA